MDCHWAWKRLKVVVLLFSVNEDFNSDTIAWLAADFHTKAPESVGSSLSFLAYDQNLNVMALPARQRD